MTNRYEAKKQLLADYPCRVELHAHTSPGSRCACVPVDDVIRIFADAGYDGIAITNHFFTEIFQTYYNTTDKQQTLERYLSDYYAAREAGEKYGIRVYLGAELRWDRVNNNDYLIYGIDEAMLGDIYDFIAATPEEFVRACKSEKSVFIQAHPFRKGLTRLDPSLLDGIEAFNLHPGHNGAVALASQYADAHHLMKTAGTDYHHEGHHGISATRFATLPADSFELAAALKKNDFLIEIGESLLLP